MLYTSRWAGQFDDSLPQAVGPWERQTVPVLYTIPTPICRQIAMSFPGFNSYMQVQLRRKAICSAMGCCSVNNDLTSCIPLQTKLIYGLAHDEFLQEFQHGHPLGLGVGGIADASVYPVNTIVLSKFLVRIKFSTALESGIYTSCCLNPPHAVYQILQMDQHMMNSYKSSWHGNLLGGIIIRGVASWLHLYQSVNS